MSFGFAEWKNGQTFAHPLGKGILLIFRRDRQQNCLALRIDAGSDDFILADDLREVGARVELKCLSHARPSRVCRGVDRTPGRDETYQEWYSLPSDSCVELANAAGLQQNWK